MSKIIEITQAEINGAETNSVDAKTIHKHLGVKTAYTTWITRAIEKYDFQDGEDFISILKENTRGRPSKKFIVSLDMAKELCLIENTPKGKETRKYFIQVEKKSNTQPMLPQNVMKEIKLALAGVVEVDKRLDTHHDRLIDLEQNARLSNQQEYELTQVHHRKVYELAKQYGDDQNDKKLISKLHRQVWSIFKKHFMLPRFNELKAKDFVSGVTFLRNIKLKDI